ncbi:alpha/beta-hydrolase [Penicillium herquei]|nr:alpha/beta-hydrolase [Penicillium herquei]
MAPKYFDVIEHRVLSSYVREYAGATVLNQEDHLYLPVKQYVTQNPTQNKLPPVTIVACASAGNPIEVYEPIWETLYEQSVELGFNIGSIWMADPVNQGKGESINAGKLGDDPSWMDHTRDLLNMINQFRDQMPRPLIGIGHSAGGAQIANLAFMHPRLLSSIIFLDPAILKTPPTQFREHPIFHKYILNRPASWPSRAQAEASIPKWPTYAGWDKRCLQRFLEYGLVDLPVPESSSEDVKVNVPVAFATSVAQEIHFLGRRPMGQRQADGKMKLDRDAAPDVDPLDAGDLLYRHEMRATWNLLPELRPSAKFILGGKSYLPLHELREGIQLCGTGRSGSGGIQSGRVCEVMLKRDRILSQWSWWIKLRRNVRPGSNQRWRDGRSKN